MIEPKRTNTGAFDFVIVPGKIGVLRSMDSRGFVSVTESVPIARRGSLTRVGFVIKPSLDDRGLRIELVVELTDERRLVSLVDVCLE